VNEDYSIRYDQRAQAEMYAGSKYAGPYLRERGITIESVVANEIELRGSIGDNRTLSKHYFLRLKRDRWHTGALHEIVEEAIWIPCQDGDRNIRCWVLRPFPALPGENGDKPTKFLIPTGNGYFPFIPRETWGVKDKAKSPLVFTEGPCKGIAIAQSGGFPIASHGVWLATQKLANGSTILHPGLKDFKLSGRTTYIAFDADMDENPEVLRAMLRLAVLLFKAGAVTKVLRWDIRKGKGIDDYLVGQENPTQALQALYANAQEFAHVARPSEMDFIQGEIRNARLGEAKRAQLCTMLEGNLKVPAQTLEKDANKKAYSEIAKELGEPFQRTKTSYTINQSYFARLWSTKRTALYDERSEAFYQYNPEKGLFQTLRENEVRRLISEDLFAEAQTYNIISIGSKISAALQRGVMDLVKCDAHGCHKDYFKRDNTAPPIIHCKNCMVCITDQGIKEESFNEKYRSRNQIPINYDPEKQCPKFLTNLLKPVLSSEDVDMLQRHCGLILIGGNRAQKILFLLGKGGTGKGTIVRLIVLVLGTDNVVQLRVDKLNGRFETARLIGKLLLNAVEAPQEFFCQPGAEVVKALCGHDVMDGEKKGVNDPLSFEGLFPVIVTSNEQLNVRTAGDEEAWIRRLEIIDFPIPRPPGAEIVHHLEEVLIKEEGEGIFAWMIEGAQSHWEELQAHKGFHSTPTQKERVHNLIARSKSMEIFISTELKPEENGTVTVGELYDGYCKFCTNKEWVPVKEQTFETTSRHLIGKFWNAAKSNDIERFGKKTKRGYHAISLITPLVNPSGASGEYDYAD
jgi:P4 family phage/plasmid primase-like protien